MNFIFISRRFDREKSRELLSDLVIVRIHKYRATSESSQRSAPAATQATGRNDGRSINYSMTIRCSPNIYSISIFRRWTRTRAFRTRVVYLETCVRARSRYQRLAMFQELFSFSECSLELLKPLEPLASSPLNRAHFCCSLAKIRRRGYATYLLVTRFPRKIRTADVNYHLCASRETW